MSLVNTAFEKLSQLYIKNRWFPRLPNRFFQMLNKIDEKIDYGSKTITRNNLSFNVSRSIRFDLYFWSNNAWEANTYRIMTKYLDHQHSYIDMGAWIGPTVLYGSQLSRYTYAIEPDPIALSYLRKNIRKNPDLIEKISIIDYCIGPENGMNKLGTKDAGGSGSSLLLTAGVKFFQVKSITFEKLIESFKIDDCNFIKIDIEGSEFLILPTMKRFIQKVHPTLYLSIHGFYSKRPLDDLKSIIDILNNYEHFEDDKGCTINLEELLVKKEWREGAHEILATNNK